MLTKKFVKRGFTFKFHAKVWSCNRPFSNERRLLGSFFAVKNRKCEGNLGYFKIKIIT